MSTDFENSENLHAIARFFAPVNNSVFRVNQFIRAGMTGIKGVGTKLAKDIEDLTEDFLGEFDSQKGEAVTLFRTDCEISAALPAIDTAHYANPDLSWWELYSLLMWPSAQVLRAMPTGSQLGCITAYQGEKTAIRVQIDWEGGHNIGLRPSEQGWKWKAGTIFAISEL